MNVVREGLRRLANLLFLLGLAATSLVGQTGSKEYIHLGGRIVAIENASVTITTTTLPPATLNTLYNAQLSATGGYGTYTWSATPGSLPPGLQLSSGGVISGTPTAVGSFKVYVQDSSTPTPLTSFTTLTIAANGISVTTTSPLPPAAVGSAYSTTLQSGGTMPFAWAITGGTLPPGLILNASSGVISGTPTQDPATTGTYSITVQVTDSAQMTGSNTLSIAVLAVTTTALSPGAVGVPYPNVNLTAVGGSSNYQWSGTPPSGLTLSSAGTISGTPTTAGTFTFTAHVTDTQTGLTATSGPISITVGSTSLTINTSRILPTALPNSGYSVTLSASGGSGSYTWTLTNPPAGVACSSNGVISVTTAAPGAYSLAVSVKDAQNQSLTASTTLSLTVVAPLSVSPVGGTRWYFPLGPSTFSTQFESTGGTWPLTWTASGLPSWLTMSSTGVLSVKGGQVSGATGDYSFTVTVTDSSSPALSQTLTYYYTVTPGTLCLGTGGAAVAVPAGQTLGFNATDCASHAVPASWSLEGRGTLSPTVNSPTSTYTAPSAVFPNEDGTVTINANSSSALLHIFPLPPAPAVAPSISSAIAGQASTFTVTGSQADNWTSTNDYLYVDFSNSGRYQSNYSCTVWYQPMTQTMSLAGDDWSTSTSGTIGSSVILHNSQCSVNLAGVSTTQSGVMLSVSLPITFSAAYPGQKTIFAQAYPDTDSLYYSVGTVTMAGSPAITSVSPATGPAGTAVTITGSNFGSSQWGSTVTFNGTAATASSWSTTSIVAIVPGAATSGNIVVTVGGVSATWSSFTVIPTPSITSLAPISGPVGTSVTIAGTNFGSIQGASTVTFNGVSAAVSSWSVSSIVVTVPGGATTGNVVVTVGGVPSSGSTFTVSSTVVSLYTTSGTWTAPAGVTSVQAECWGPGGNGANSAYFNVYGTDQWMGGGGGGGGAYAKRNSLAVTSGTQYSVVVGAGGGSTQTSFAGSGCLADYGRNGGTSQTYGVPGIGGSGGSSSNSVGDTKVSGTDGTTAGNPYGGNGGAGANGGAGGAGAAFSMPAYPGTAPGGGGGGGLTGAGSHSGASGAVGQVRLTYTPVIPAISSLSPTSGQVGTAVTITGINFGSSQSTGTVTFNGTAATVTTWSATSIAVTVPSAATTGNVVVTVGGQASNGISFTVTAPPVTVTIAPTSATLTFSQTQQFAATVTNNSNTNVTWSISPTIGAVSSSAVYQAPSSITVQQTVTVTATSVADTSKSASATVTLQPVPVPSITSLSITSGAVGTAVIITGASFGSGQSSSTVTFNGTAAPVTSWSATSIAVIVPSGATSGNIVVTVGGQASNGITFTVAPWITSLSPASGTAGTSVTISGSSFGPTQSSSAVTFNGAAAAVTNWSTTGITAVVPSGATSGNVVVTVGGLASNGVSFAVVPAIANLSPASGSVGTAVTITGTGFGATQSSSTVTFNGTSATVTNWSTTGITAVVPSSAGSGNVVVTVGGLASNGVSFAVIPTISNLSPASGSVGTAVTITGTGFGATQSSSTVTFNGASATATNWSANSISVNVPAGAASGNVVVTVGGLSSAGMAFTVTVPLSITTVAPASGPVDATVTISGTNFGSSQGGSTVTFNGTAAVATNWSATSITVTVPGGATTGNVVVTVGGISSNGVTFTVTTWNGYSYRRAITIDHTKVPNTDQTNFPALISGTYPYLATTANGGKVQNANGYDVGFYGSGDCATGKMAWETESYNAATGTVAYWLNIATLSHTADTVIYLCYGSTSATVDQSNKTAAWNSTYVGVWHFGNGTTLSTADSTSNNDATVNYGLTAAAGKIGGGANFNGSSYATTSLPANNNTYSVCWWVNMATVAGAQHFIEGVAFQNMLNSGTWYAKYNTVVGGPLTTSSWTHLCFTQSATTMSTYINGVPQQSVGATYTLRSALYFGRYAGSGVEYLAAVMDEAEISNAVLTSDWIAAQYANQSSPSTFYSVGGENQ
jgi:hypothetical protein